MFRQDRTKIYMASETLHLYHKFKEASAIQVICIENQRLDDWPIYYLRAMKAGSFSHIKDSSREVCHCGISWN
jgi:hypothetical protein